MAAASNEISKQRIKSVMTAAKSVMANHGNEKASKNGSGVIKKKPAKGRR